MTNRFPYFVLPGTWPPTGPHIFIQCRLCNVELPTTWNSEDQRCRCGNIEVHERGVYLKQSNDFQCFSDIQLEEGRKPNKGELYKGVLYWGD